MKFKVPIYVLLSSLLASSSWGAVTFDQVTTGSCASCSSVSFSCTVSAGSDRLLLGSVSAKRAGSSEITGVTYNSVSLTNVDGIDNGSVSSHLWQLVASATGANTFVATSTATDFELNAACESYTGVDQTTPLGTSVTASGTDTAPSVTVTSASGELVKDAIGLDHSGTLTVGSGQTSRYNEIGLGGWNKYAGSTEAGGSSVVMDWSDSASVNWASVGVSIKPAGAGGGTVGSRLHLFGVGK